MSFWESSFLWFEAVVASSAVAAMCGIIGVYTILRRVVFFPAALSQVSGVGVVLAFALVGLFPALGNVVFFRPEVLALVVTVVGALVLGWVREPVGLSREALLGIVYIIGSALVVLIGDGIPQEHHEVEDILFGNAVAVETSQMYLALGTAVLVIGIHSFFHRPFVMASFDPQTAIAHNVPIRVIDSTLFMSIGLVIAVATKAIGAMPVFAFSVLPAATALKLFNDIRLILAASAALGAAGAFIGYYISFKADLPTGACTVATVGLIFILTWFFDKFIRQHFFSK